MARPRTAGLPPCPLGHSGHTVLYGTYGPRRYGRRGGRRPFPDERATRKRQRYLCVPEANVARRHVFTEKLPRLQPLPDPGQPQQTVLCASCEQPLTARAGGPPAPRHFSFAARDIARALIDVGKGITYRQAGTTVRRDTNVHRLNDRTQHDWSLVADWVEIFAPLLADRLMPKRWHDAVLVDSVPFSTRGRRNKAGQLVQGGHYTFSVLIAVCWSRGGFKIFAIETCPGPNPPDKQDWFGFLSRLRGTPIRVVSDEDATLKAVLPWKWPSVEHRIGWDKLYLRLWRDKLSILARIDHHNEFDPIYQLAQEAFESPRHWLNFLQMVRLLRPKPRTVGKRTYSLQRWIRDHRKLIREQLAAGHYFPQDTTAIEQLAAEIRDQMRKRHGMYRNKLRTDRMLQLMALHQNGLDRENEYERIIRAYLESHSGCADRRHVVYAGPRLRVFP